jgi:hypothetical protein
MYDDDDIEAAINEEILYDIVNRPPGPPPTAEQLEEFGCYNVQCKSGCGTFALEETEALSIDLSQGTATFRCRTCNDIQTAELLIID